MKIQSILASALALAALAPGVASASLILDTGTPPVSGTQSVMLNSSDWYAAELTVTAGETITALSAFLTQGTGQPGDTFSWDLYSAAGTFLGANSSTREPLTDTAPGTFTSNGWNSVNVNWTPAAGTYWLALQVSSSAQTRGLDLPTESAATTAVGTAPALAFASATGSTNPKFQIETANPVGLQVTAVPLPAAAWLLGTGLLGLGAGARRRRS